MVEGSSAGGGIGVGGNSSVVLVVGGMEGGSVVGGMEEGSVVKFS